MGPGAFRTGTYDNRRVEVTSTEYAVYIGGNVKRGPFAFKGTAVKGEDHSLYSYDASYTVPVGTEGVAIKINYRADFLSPAPIGKLELNSVVTTSLVANW